jgi:hypothetical protein
LTARVQKTALPRSLFDILLMVSCGVAMLNKQQGTPGKEQRKDVCTMCRIIRIYLMIGAPIVVMMMLGQQAEALRGIMLTNIFSVIVGVAFVALVSWKAYDEFWRR